MSNKLVKASNVTKQTARQNYSKLNPANSIVA